MTQHHYQRVWSNIFHSQEITSTKDSKGYIICSSSSKITDMSFGNIFVCEGKEYISSLLVLDGKNDCPDMYFSKNDPNLKNKQATSSDEHCFSLSMKCPLFC